LWVFIHSCAIVRIGRGNLVEMCEIDLIRREL